MAEKSSWTANPTRRDVLAALLGVPVALAAGCSSKKPPLPEGTMVGASDGVGHRLRQASYRPEPDAGRWQNKGVVIVGGGIAGLSAGWRLILAGFDDFVVLELEPKPGGTSRSGTSPVASYPWGAHYLPVPLKENRALIRLLKEMGIVEGIDAEGELIVGEEELIRSPEQRIFGKGVWTVSDLPYLHLGEGPDDRAELAKFNELIRKWVGWRDGKGRRAFAIPIARGSDDRDVTELDRMSMADWLDKNELTSRRLRWMVDYACRDDYGAVAADVSAWPGLFYFCSRKRKPGYSQPFMAWPEGNGKLVNHFVARLRKQRKDMLRVGLLVSGVSPVERGGKAGVDVVAVDDQNRQVLGYRAERVIFAAPQFLTPYLIRGLPDERARLLSSFEYSVWMVANLHLKDRPEGDMLAWDNIIYNSKSLGYVTATHQLSQDYGPTVLTYYYPLTDGPPYQARQQLLGTGWSEWAEVALTDLERVHPDIRTLTERLDVMRWGHAMPRPRPGNVWSGQRLKAQQPYRGIHFAHSDLSGVGIMEEAFYQGIRAAEEVMSARGIKHESIL
jgi:protoporphyrinogen oxidase